MESNKKNKPKKYLIRHFVKEMKRVKWPTAKQNWVSFTQTIVFAVLVTLFIFGFTALITYFFKGIGINTN